MVCQGVLSWPLVKVMRLWWIKRTYGTAAFPLQTLGISSAIKNQHPVRRNHFIHQIIPLCWGSAVAILVMPETKPVAWASTMATEAAAMSTSTSCPPHPAFCWPEQEGPWATVQPGAAEPRWTHACWRYGLEGSPAPQTRTTKAAHSNHISAVVRARGFLTPQPRQLLPWQIMSTMQHSFPAHGGCSHTRTCRHRYAHSPSYAK